MKKALPALLLTAALNAQAAPDPAAARARFVDLTDLAQLAGSLHKEAQASLNDDILILNSVMLFLLMERNKG